MVMRVNITISPVNLSDLYVINESVPSDRVQRLSDFQDSGSVLEGRVVGIDGTDVIRIISSGYVEQVTTLNALDQNPNIVLVSSNDAENLSDGTNTYPIADKTARELINSLDDCAFNGVYVDQTYDSTSANAQSGTAVAEAIADAFDALYPVGSRYITENATCPLSTLIPGSTWVLTSQGRVIQGADNNHAVGTTANAGLPNITGLVYSTITTVANHTINASGCLKYYEYYDTGLQSNNDSIMKCYSLGLDASLSNSIYGNSATVQPPAEFVNIFKRTA